MLEILAIIVLIPVAIVALVVLAPLFVLAAGIVTFIMIPVALGLGGAILAVLLEAPVGDFFALGFAGGLVLDFVWYVAESA